MKIGIISALSIFVLSGCVTMPQEQPFSSRIEIEQFSKDRPYNRENWFYCGTDAKNHHFVTRIGGNSKRFIIPKQQINLTRTIPLPPSGVIAIYQIYPDNDFRFGNDRFEWNYIH